MPALGTGVAFAVPAALFVLVAVAVLAPGWTEPRQTVAPGIRDAVLAPLASPVVRGAAACILAVGLVGSAAQTLAPLRLGEAGFSARDLGGLLILGAVLALLGMPLAGFLSDRVGARRTALGWASVVTTLTLAPAILGSRWVVVCLLVAIVPLGRVGGVLGFALGAEHAPAGAGLAAGYGLALSAWSLGAVVGPVLAGTLAEAAGDAAAFAAIGCLAGVLALPIAAARPQPHGRYAIA